MAQTTSIDPLSFVTLLDRAVSEPGLFSRAYSTFHGYSFGNQLLALAQCLERGLEPGPIATGLPGAEHCRGYIQHWNVERGADPIPERSAQRIFKAADTILRAGSETVGR